VKESRVRLGASLLEEPAGLECVVAWTFGGVHYGRSYHGDAHAGMSLQAER